MLPFLPALILLIVQGPANVERMAYRGELPAMLNALHHQIRSGDAEAFELSPTEEELMLASLLSMSNDQQLSLTILKLLHASNITETPCADLSYSTGQSDESSGQHTRQRTLGLLTQGFLKSQKSRDGPVLS